MSLCIASAAGVMALATSSFTLSWTHSVEKIRWTEHWELSAAGLRPVLAEVAGSGAGMEIPDGAWQENGTWRYRPSVPAQNQVLLAASGMTPSAWQLCASGACLELGATAEAPVLLWQAALCRAPEG